METAIVWIKENWDAVLAAWGALVALATVIVKLTPTQSDDALLAKVVKFLDNFSVVNPKPPVK